MKKRNIKFKIICKNLIKGFNETLKTLGEVLKAPFEMFLDLLEDLSHE